MGASTPFPIASFPGIQITIKRTGPIYPVLIQTSSSGKEQRALFAGNPRYKYEMQFEFLRSGTEAELQALLTFIIARNGQYDYFQITDPVTSSSVNVRFDTDSFEFQRFVTNIWELPSLPMISVL